MPPARTLLARGRSRRGAVALALATLLPPVAGPGRAADEPLRPPEGPILLVIGGAIELSNVGEEAHLDRGHLERLPRTRFRTRTPWSDAEDGHVFEGARLDALLAAVGASGVRVRALGSDDYAATFHRGDLERYPVIVADTQDGVRLTTRRLGPLRIMFPFDDHPELLTEANLAAAVWQLIRMDVR